MPSSKRTFILKTVVIFSIGQFRIYKVVILAEFGAQDTDLITARVSTARQTESKDEILLAYKLLQWISNCRF
jgi:hypothetical protein